MSRAGKILRVNLTKRSIETEPTSKYAKDFIGGGAIGVKLMWDNVPPEVNGLDPENMLTFNTGPLTGTLLGTRLEVITKSPGIQNSPLVTAGLGGQFPAELKFAGFDNIAITGKSDKPVYIHIEDGTVEIKDADHLWGMDTQMTQELIKEELNDPDIQVACIGQAGENQVVSAVILHDIQNASGQGGVGAVMGSKNLKAIAVRGTGGLKIADPRGLQERWDYLWDNLTRGRASIWGREVNKYQAASHADYATDHKFIARWGYGPRAPFADPPSKEESLVAFNEKYKVSNLGCTFCPLQCQGNYSAPGIGNSGVGCFTNVISRWFAKTYDTNIWWKSIVLINEYGLNVAEILSIQGWLMLLYEKGMITAEDTDGIPMEWGSQEATVALIDKIALQEGFGKYFKGGAIPASDHIGGEDALNLALVDRNNMYPLDYFAERGAFIGGVGGSQLLRAATQYFWIEPNSDVLGMYQPVAKALGLSGEEAIELLEEWLSELSSKHTGNKDAWRAQAVEGKAKYLAANENAIISSDISGKCDWSTTKLAQCGFIWDTEDTAKAVCAATGEKCSLERMLDVVQKKRIMEIAYNILCEMMISEFPVVSDATVAMFTEPTKGGEFDGCEWDEEGTETVGEEYCHIRGCDPETGVPTRKELERLGLKYIADRLEEHGLDVGSTSDDESTYIEDAEGPEPAKEERSKARGRRSEDAVSVKAI